MPVVSPIIMTKREFLTSMTAAIAGTAAAGNAAPTITDAQELRRGGLYCLHCEDYLGETAHENIRRALDPFTKEFGVMFIVLDRGMRLANPDRATIDADELADKIAARLQAEFSCGT